MKSNVKNKSPSSSRWPRESRLDKSQLYKKFQRLSARPTAGESSTGLGLAIIKALADKLRGMVELTSAPGEGAEFVVKIPKNPESSAASPNSTSSSNARVRD